MTAPRLAVLLTVAAACGGGSAPSEPKPPTGGAAVLQIVSGAPLTDTIWTRRSLRVRVTRNGQPASGSLTFTATAIDQHPFGGLQNTGLPSATLQLDAYGETVVQILFGSWTGAAHLRISGLGIADSLPVQVLPGNTYALHLSPRDTALLSGGTFTLTARTEDRLGNPRPDPVELTSTSPSRAALSGTSVTALDVGRAWIRAASGAFTDSIGVGVVPGGRFLAIDRPLFSPGRLLSLAFDGSGRTVLLTDEDNVGYALPHHHPDDEAIVFHAVDPWFVGRPERLYRWTPGAPPARVLNDNAVLRETQPVYSPDGAWIYFSAGVSDISLEVWRVRPDGTDPERLTPPAGPWERDFNPHPSPDGSRLAYTTVIAGERYSRILALDTRVVQEIDVAGFSPRWSPVGDRIAFVRGEDLWIMRPDGSDVRQLVPSGQVRFQEYLDWTVGGRFIIARTRSGLVLVDVDSDGQLLPIPGSAELEEPATLRQPAAPLFSRRAR